MSNLELPTTQEIISRLKLILSNLEGECVRHYEIIESIDKLLATDSKKYAYHFGCRDGLEIAIFKLSRILEEYERD
jgi:hypothetical protein